MIQGRKGPLSGLERKRLRVMPIVALEIGTMVDLALVSVWAAGTVISTSGSESELGLVPVELESALAKRAFSMSGSSLARFAGFWLI